MIEDVLIEDLRERGVGITRSTPFVRLSLDSDMKAPLNVVCLDNKLSKEKILHSKYLVGCDGARSMVRASIPGADMIGDSTRAPWGVLDGILPNSYII
jgi:phenol 2-monooxygenase